VRQDWSSGTVIGFLSLNDHSLTLQLASVQAQSVV